MLSQVDGCGFRFGEQEQDKEHEQEVGGGRGYGWSCSPLWSRNAVPRPGNIDDFAHSTRNGTRHGAYQTVTPERGRSTRVGSQVKGGAKCEREDFLLH